MNEILPPKPKDEDLKKHGWFMTGECRTPDPAKREYWCVVYESIFKGVFSPWSSFTGKPTPHPEYGTKRWIILPLKRKRKPALTRKPKPVTIPS